MTTAASLRSMLPGLTALALPEHTQAVHDGYLHLISNSPARPDADYLIAATGRVLNASSPQISVSASAVARLTASTRTAALGAEVMPALAWVFTKPEAPTVIRMVIAPVALVEEHAQRGGMFSIGEKNGGYYLNTDRLEEVAHLEGVAAHASLPFYDELAAAMESDAGESEALDMPPF